MKCVLVDYSGSFRNTGQASLPKRSGKFIQIRTGDTEYLVFSTADLSQYHANISERFFTDHGVWGTYNSKRDFYRIDDPAWEIVGGGAWSADYDSKTLHLSGISQAYGRFDEAGLHTRVKAFREFHGFNVTIS